MGEFIKGTGPSPIEVMSLMEDNENTMRLDTIRGLMVLLVLSA